MDASNEPFGEIVHRGKSLWNDFPVPQRMMENEKFKAYSASFQVVYFGLAYLAHLYADKEGWFFHTLRNFAKFVKKDVKTVWAAKNQMVKDGFIEYEDGGRSPLNGFRQAGNWRVRGGEIKPLDKPVEDGQNELRNEDVDD